MQKIDQYDNTLKHNTSYINFMSISMGFHG